MYAQPHEGRIRYRVVDESSGGAFKSANATVGMPAGAMISSTQQQKGGRPAADGAGPGKEGETVPSGGGGGQEWSATVTSRRDPTTGKLWDSIRFGEDDRASKFQKASALSFT